MEEETDGDANLTTGAITMICGGVEVIEPVLQVADLRPVHMAQGTTARYRMILSDGDHVVQAMLATQMNGLVTEGRLRRGSIVQLNSFFFNVIQGRRIIIAISLKVLIGNCELMGSPASFDSDPVACQNESATPTVLARVNQQCTASGNPQSHAGAMPGRDASGARSLHPQAEIGAEDPLGGRQTSVQQAHEQLHPMDRIKALRKELLDEMDRMDAKYCIRILQVRRDAQARENELAYEWIAKHMQLIKFLKEINRR